MARTKIKETGLDPQIVTAITSGAGPKITTIQVTDNSYNVLDDIAVDVVGGYAKITGSGFASGCNVLIGTVPATSVVFISSTEVRIQVPATVAGTYTVYLTNPDGGVAIRINGISFSALPTWSTGSELTADSGSLLSIQLSAIGASAYSLAPGSSLPAGLSLSSGGLLSGTVVVESNTVYNFTIVATDNELQDSNRAFSINVTVGDPYFNLTPLLISGSGTNNASNNTFVDSSPTNAALTKNNTSISQSSFSPYNTKWSSYFDGNGDSLSVTGIAGYSIATSTTPFTVECWVNPTAAGGVIFSEEYTGSSNPIVVTLSMSSTGAADATDGRYISFGWYTGSSWVTAARSTTEVPLNTWTHVAAVFTGSTTKIYIDGTDVTTGTPATTWGVTASAGNTWFIGRRWDTTGTAYFTGYISNLRYTVGQAVYTTTFTPSSQPLTATGNTQLLACHANRFIDGSANNATITVNNDVAVSPLSPFLLPASVYNTATHGGSLYHPLATDATGKLTTASSATFNLGTSNWTMEFWVYPLSQSDSVADPNTPLSGHDGTNWWFISWVVPGYQGEWKFYSSTMNGGPNHMYGGTAGGPTGKYKQWIHIAVTRSGGVFKFYHNGKLTGTSSTYSAATNLTSANTVVRIGERSHCFLTDVRIVKSVVYTADFIPPTSPLTSITDTILLLNGRNAAIFDATRKNALIAFNDAKISTVQSKWGSGSLYFDGVGDYLQVVPGSPVAGHLYNFSGNFTIEAWVYTTANDVVGGVYRTIFATSVFNSTGIGLKVQASGGAGTTGVACVWYNGSQILTGTTVISNGAWHHVAVSRSGTTIRLFVNGTQESSTTQSAVISVAAGYPTVGGESATTGNYSGYIQDLRIAQVARYTGNFVAPTATFQLK